jgi:hypothetical protein
MIHGGARFRDRDPWFFAKPTKFPGFLQVVVNQQASKHRSITADLFNGGLLVAPMIFQVSQILKNNLQEFEVITRKHSAHPFVFCFLRTERFPGSRLHIDAATIFW